MRLAIGARLGVLMAAAFVETLGNFLILALLPYYADRFGASPTAIGVLVAAFAFAQMVTAPLWGRVSDRVGRRPVIVLGLLLAAASYLVFAFASSFVLLMVCRLVQGAGGGTVSVVFAYVSDSLAPEQRAEGLGWLTSATSLAAMIGPAIGSFASRFDPAAPGLVVAAIGGLVALLVLVRLPEPIVEHAGEEGVTPPESVWASMTRVLSEPTRPTSGLIWIYSVGMVAFTALTAVIALFLQQRFGVGEDSIWMFFAFLGGASIVMRLFALGPAVRRFGEARLLRVGVVILAVAMMMIPLPSSLIVLSLTIVLVPAATALLFPCTTALLTRQETERARVGQLLGVQQAFGGLSKIAGPLWAGILFERFGPGSPFVTTGALLLVVGLFAFRLRLPGGQAASAAR